MSLAVGESWRVFFANYADTLGINALFAFFGSGIQLWTSKEPISIGRALLVISAGLFVASIATAIAQGFLGWSIFVGPGIGFLCGLISYPLVKTTARKVEERAPEMVDKAIDLLPGRKESK